MSLCVGHATTKVFEGEGVIRSATYFQIVPGKKVSVLYLQHFLLLLLFFFLFLVILRLFPNKYLN